MSLEKVFKKEYRKIEEESRVKKNVLFYFSAFINSNYNALVKVFSPIIAEQFKESIEHLVDDILENGMETVRQDFFESRLYFESSEMIKKLDNDAKKTMDVERYKEKIRTPDIQLGFSEYFVYSGLSVIGKRLTEKGVSEVNSYRKAMK